MSKTLKNSLPMLGVAALVLSAAPLMAKEPGSCQSVRFVEVGWTDVAATTALTREVLEGLGYDTWTNTASVPLVYSGLRNGDFDIFLGDRMPAMASISDPYVDQGDVDRVAANLHGAKYTLAVPQYVHDAGVTSVTDLAEHAERFGQRLYGIEAGSDGNLIIQDMIDDEAFGLEEWRLIDSSEAGMLAELRSKVQSEEWMVFLGWEPHPMNVNFDIAYLEGADDYFGPDRGRETVYTNTRAGYVEECANVGTLLKNLEFTLEMESRLMSAILDEGKEPRAAARAYLRKHPGVLKPWLDGVSAREGEDGLKAVRSALGIEG